jgi:hypothetical protein
MLEAGQHVSYSHFVPASKDAPAGLAERDAIVLRVEPPTADGFYHIDLAYLNPVKLPLVFGADWRDAFERAISVPALASDVEASHGWAFPEATAVVEQENDTLRKRLSQAGNLEAGVGRLRDFLLGQTFAALPDESVSDFAIRIIKNLTTPAAPAPPQPEELPPGAGPQLVPSAADLDAVASEQVAAESTEAAPAPEPAPATDSGS